jgi:hypothetical protein
MRGSSAIFADATSLRRWATTLGFTWATTPLSLAISAGVAPAPKQKKRQAALGMSGMDHARSQERRILAHGVPRTLSDSQGQTEIFVNIETGELMGPEGVAFKDLQIPMVELRLTLTRPDKEPYLVILAREFPDRRIKASIVRVKALIVNEEEDTRAVLRDLLASLESKLKLAAKLREARKRRGQDAQPGKRK